MKPILVMITSSNHPWFKEGDLHDVEEFEILAIHAAQFYQTALPVCLNSLKHEEGDLHEGCVDVIVYFTETQAMEMHLHPYQGGGDYGVFDVLGDLMSTDPTNILADLERVLH